MTNFFSSIYTTIILFTLCVLGIVACFALACDLVALAPVLAAVSSVSDVLVGDGSSVVSIAAVGGVFSGLELDFRNLERKSENIEDYAGQHNPAFLVKLAKQENAQADRLEALFKSIDENPKADHFGYEGILPWRERTKYLRNIGEAKRAAAIEKAQALKEAKEADNDEEFVAGYKDFLATEFDAS